METHRKFIKFIFKVTQEISSDETIYLFHQWINEQDPEELYLDVADYSHVPKGPGIMLIGFWHNLSLNVIGSEAELILNSKRPSSPADLFEKGLAFANRLEKAFEGRLIFQDNQFVLGSNDRLLSNEESFKQLEQISQSFGQEWQTISKEQPDPRERPALKILLKPNEGLKTLNITAASFNNG